MRIHDTITQPWIIKHSMLDNIVEKTRAHISGPKIDLKEITAKLSELSDFDDSNGKYVVQGSKAIISITGVIAKNPSSFEKYMYGARSIETYMENFIDAIEDSSINHIICDMDTPGGTVPGVQEFANLIYDNRKKKKITAFTSGMVASAGYWIGAAAHEMILSGDTAEVGSIGVYTVHNDWTKWNEKNGINVSIIKAGKYKAAQHPDNKMTKDQKNYVQGQIDYLYDVFTRDVAKFRGVSQEIVLENMADGRIFIGQQAIDTGLADKMMTMDKLLDIEIKDNSNSFVNDDFDDTLIKTESNNQAGEFDNDNKVIVSGVNTKTVEVEIKKTEDIMSLKEILAANPGAQAEYDSNIKAAEQKGKDAVYAIGEEVSKFMTDDNDHRVREAAIKAVSGKGSIEAVNTLASTDAMIKESKKSAEAVIESEALGEVIPDPQGIPKASEDGKIETEIDMKASIEDVKRMRG